ncbi:MAG: ABC transporter permease [Candidatus Delongbacteria bacterium]|nr:ABC transporter permease [Candidatus Delongbacteria bacterium]
MLDRILLLAHKDLRLLWRDRGALFSVLLFPLLFSVFFGLMFSGGGSGGGAKISLAVADEDSSAASQAFVTGLEGNPGLAVRRASLDDARALVRRGKVAAWLRLPQGFGDDSQNLFMGQPPSAELGLDPSRKAEGGLLQGLLQQQAAQRFNTLFSFNENTTSLLKRQRELLRDPAGQVPGWLAGLDRFYQSLDSLSAVVEATGNHAQADSAARANTGDGFVPLKITTHEESVIRKGPASSFAVSFPQGVVWALIACAASFGVAMVGERRNGLTARLEHAPLGAFELLASRALAALLSMLLISVLLFAVAALVFGLRPASWGLLVLAVFQSSLCFVGLSLCFSLLGKSEQAASGIGWGIMSLLAMLGGGMIPLIFMPGWMQTLSRISPVRWVVVSLEGAIWRGFSLAEMLVPGAVLLAIGAASFGLGVALARRRA